MKKILLGMALFASCYSFSQSASPEVISSAGSHGQNGTAQISWTLGEPITETISNSSNQLTQGFHQTHLSVISVETIDLSVTFNAFPNPTTDFVTIQLSENGLDHSLTVIDATGRILNSQEITQTEFSLDFTNYSKGTYYLHFTNQKGATAKTITLQKLN